MTPSSQLVIGCSEQLPHELRAYRLMGVSSDGALRPCLATNDCVEAGAAARAGDEAAVGVALEAAWQRKPELDWRGCTEPSARDVSMRSTGG